VGGPKTEGVLYVGKAQEKARVVRTQRRVDPRTGAKYPWLVRSTAMVNHFYFYLVDADFGPLFLKFCSCPAGDRLSSQPTSARRPTDQP
jgi:hypothetical protein